MKEKRGLYMKFSIIVAVNPKRQSIGKLLDSLKKQSYSNYEVIVITDDQTPSLVQMITPYLTDIRFRMFQKAYRGVASARNFGMQYISGDYTLFIDDDEYVDEDFLESIEDAIQDNLGIDVIKFQPKLVDENGTLIRRVFDTAFSRLSPEEAFPILIQGEYIEPAVLYAFKTEFLKQKQLLFQDGKSECDFSFVPLALVYANKIVSLTYAGMNFTKRNRRKFVTGSKEATRIVYDTLFQYDYMMKKVMEDSNLSLFLKKKFFDYLSYSVILKGTLLPDDDIAGYTIELNKREVANYLIANTISKMITKFSIKKDMDSYIKKCKSKMK